MLNLKSTITMNNGIKIPRLGFGVYRAAQGDETKNAVLNALEVGYRHIDTAFLPMVMKKVSVKRLKRVD